MLQTVYTTAGNPIQSTIYDSAVPTAGSTPAGLGEGGATGSVCAAPVTVTVTGPEQTVTVVSLLRLQRPQASDR